MRFRTTLTLVATSLLGGAALTAYTYENDQVPGHRPRYVRDLIANSENHFKTTMDSMNQRIQQKDAIITEKENAQKLKEQEEHDNQVKKQNIRDALHTMHPILKHGLPLGAEKQIICALDNAEAMPVNIAVFKKYISETDFAKKTPRWVANTIGAREPNNPDINRKNSYFKQDPGGSIPEPFQASNQDYWASGYHRGHMIPAGDMYTAKDQLTLDETFYLNNNIVPQNGRNNSGYWRRMEQFVRKLPDRVGTQVHVITGPLYLPIGDARFVQYPVIGKNNVHVPTHLYKVVLTEPTEKQPTPCLTAFVVPNAPIPSNQPLSDFEIEIQELEKMSGLLFFEKARSVQATNVEEEGEQRYNLSLPSICSKLPNGCSLQPEDPSLEFMFEINDATTNAELDKIWGEHEKAGIPVHDWTKEAYERKKAYFAGKFAPPTPPTPTELPK